MDIYVAKPMDKGIRNVGKLTSWEKPAQGSNLSAAGRLNLSICRQKNADLAKTGLSAKSRTDVEKI